MIKELIILSINNFDLRTREKCGSYGDNAKNTNCEQNLIKDFQVIHRLPIRLTQTPPRGSVWP